MPEPTVVEVGLTMTYEWMAAATVMAAALALCFCDRPRPPAARCILIVWLCLIGCHLYVLAIQRDCNQTYAARECP